MKLKKIYFVGIKGVGMASLAVIAKQAGFEVSGSDLKDEFITDSILKNQGINPLVGFTAENIDSFTKDFSKDEVLVITTSAHEGLNNPETKFAADLGIKVLTHGQAVGQFMDGVIFNRNDLEGISVAGSHGKTTISAMLATYFTRLGLDPTYTVGTSEIFPIGNAGHYGKGKYFIAEADEYASDLNSDRTPKLLYQHPKIEIINNIDFDHPDFYKDINEVEQAFSDFVDNLDNDGIIVLNGDDKRAVNLRNKIKSTQKVITFGTTSNSDFHITKYSQDGLNSFFSVESNDIYLGDFKLSVPGYHNAKNALAVIALLLELGVSVSKLQQLLPIFLGSKRRMELLGRTQNGIDIIDDYAHHPQEIKSTLSTIKKAYPKKKIMCIFQPHTYSRTKALMNDFLSSFYDVDSLGLLPVYASLREKDDDGVITQKLFEEFKKIQKNIIFFKDINFMVEYISKNIKSDSYIILTMGAGDVYKVGQRLIKSV